MASIEWSHARQRLIVPLAVFPPVTAPDPHRSIRTIGLLDTGATGTGVRSDIAAALGLKARGQRRVETANGMMMSPEYLLRLGFICGDLDLPGFEPDQQLPYVLDQDYVAFGLRDGFAYPLLIGMDVIGRSDLRVGRDGRASLKLP